MSDPASEIKAKFLLEELNRRTKWLAILRRNPKPSSWWWSIFFSTAMFLFAAVLIFRSFDTRQAIAIFVLAMALGASAQVSEETIHRRLDALVELLQQEDMLGSTLPASHREDRPQKVG